MKTYTVLGIFNDRDDVEQAIHHLKGDGFDIKDISLIMRDREKGSDIASTTGAMAGGILGVLTGLGLREEEAPVYEESVHAGGILLLVPAAEDAEDAAREIMEEFGAEEIRSVVMPTDRIHTQTMEDEALDDYYHEHIHEPMYEYGAKGGRSHRKGLFGDSKEHALASRKRRRSRK